MGTKKCPHTEKDFGYCNFVGTFWLYNAGFTRPHTYKHTQITSALLITIFNIHYHNHYSHSSFNFLFFLEINITYIKLGRSNQSYITEQYKSNEHSERPNQTRFLNSLFEAQYQTLTDYTHTHTQLAHQ